MLTCGLKDKQSRGIDVSLHAFGFPGSTFATLGYFLFILRGYIRSSTDSFIVDATVNSAEVFSSHPTSSLFPSLRQPESYLPGIWSPVVETCITESTDVKDSSAVMLCCSAFIDETCYFVWSMVCSLLETLGSVEGLLYNGYRKKMSVNAVCWTTQW